MTADFSWLAWEAQMALHMPEKSGTLGKRRVTYVFLDLRDVREV